MLSLSYNVVLSSGIAYALLVSDPLTRFVAKIPYPLSAQSGFCRLGLRLTSIQSCVQYYLVDMFFMYIRVKELNGVITIGT